MKMTLNMKNKFEDNLKCRDDQKFVDNLKYEVGLKYEDNLKKTNPNQIYQTKPVQPNLSNQSKPSK